MALLYVLFFVSYAPSLLLLLDLGWRTLLGVAMFLSWLVVRRGCPTTCWFNLGVGLDLV